jgi:hypothetical protein
MAGSDVQIVSPGNYFKGSPHLSHLGPFRIMCLWEENGIYGANNIVSQHPVARS